MEIRLVIFLAFTSVIVVTNTLLIWFAYKAFAGFTSRVTETVTEFERSNVTRAWIQTMQAAAERAVTVTEFAKQKMTDLGSVLDRAQGRYQSALASADSKLEQVGDGLTTTARKVRDTVAKPAFSLMSFMAGLMGALESFGSDEEA